MYTVISEYSSTCQLQRPADSSDGIHGRTGTSQTHLAHRCSCRCCLEGLAEDSSAHKRNECQVSLVLPDRHLQSLHHGMKHAGGKPPPSGAAHTSGTVADLLRSVAKKAWLKCATASASGGAAVLASQNTTCATPCSRSASAATEDKTCSALASCYQVHGNNCEVRLFPFFSCLVRWTEHVLLTLHSRREACPKVSHPSTNISQAHDGAQSALWRSMPCADHCNPGLPG